MQDSDNITNYDDYYDNFWGEEYNDYPTDYEEVSAFTEETRINFAKYGNKNSSIGSKDSINNSFVI